MKLFNPINVSPSQRCARAYRHVCMVHLQVWLARGRLALCSQSQGTSTAHISHTTVYLVAAQCVAQARGRALGAQRRAAAKQGSLGVVQQAAQLRAPHTRPAAQAPNGVSKKIRHVRRSKLGDEVLVPKHMQVHGMRHLLSAVRVAAPWPQHGGEQCCAASVRMCRDE